MKRLSAVIRCVPLSMLVLGCPIDVDIGGSSGTSDGDDNANTGDGDGDGDAGDETLNHRTYFISESTKFEGDDKCPGEDVITVTNSLRNALDDAGWRGLRFTGENAWPEDLMETSLDDNGLDGDYGDAARFIVFAGHGSPGQLHWGVPSPNEKCNASVRYESRLGTLSGDMAAAVMFLASCTMRVDKLWYNYADQMSRQLFGYHNSHTSGLTSLAKCSSALKTGRPWQTLGSRPC